MEFSEELRFGYGYQGFLVPSLSDLKNMISKAPHLKVFEYYCEDCEIESKFTANKNVHVAEVAQHEEKCPVQCLETLAMSCPELTTLVLQCRPATSVTINTLVSRCAMLSSLSLYKVGGTDSSQYMPFVRLKHLSVLELHFCKWVDDNFLSAMARGGAQLRCLYLHELNNASEDAVCLLLKLNRETLLSLSLGQRNSSGLTYSTVSLCSRLKSLKISCAKSIRLLSMRTLGALPALEKLYLDFLSSLEALQVEHILLMGGFKNIKEVYFTKCDSLHDFVLECLIKEAHQLSVIYVDDCRKITGHGLKLSVAAGQNLTAIHLLKIDLRDLTFLENISARVPTLRLLTMYRCTVNSSIEFLGLISRESRRTLKIYTDQNIEARFCVNVLPTLPAIQCRRLGVRYDLFDLNSHAQLPPNIPYGFRPADQC